MAILKHDRGRSRWLAVVVIAFLALSLRAQSGGRAFIAAQDQRTIDGIYRGMIGGAEVVVELRGPLQGEHAKHYAHAGDKDTYPIHGSYFYRRHGVSIELVGTPLGDGVAGLREYKRKDAERDEFTAEWRLSWSASASGCGEGNAGDAAKGSSTPARQNRAVRGPGCAPVKATGTFCKYDPEDSGRAEFPSAPACKRPLKILLTRVSRALTPGAKYKPHSGNTYYDLLLDFPLQESPEIQVSPEVAYRMRTDPRFKVSRPRLTRFPDTGVMARINRDLNSNFTESRLQAAETLSEGESGGFEAFYEETASGNFSLPYVFSFLVETQSFTGGAHPNEGGYSLNYDLRTGKRFELEEAFQTSPGSKDSSGPILAKLYLRHYVKPPEKDAPPDTDCGKVVREKLSLGGFRPLLFLNQDGLAIEPPLPHVLIACGPSVTVPFGELRPYVRKESPLGPLVEERSEKK